MSKPKPITCVDLIKRLRKFGFAGPYQGGKHMFMIKGMLRLTLPNPRRKEIGTDLLSRILKQAGISRTEWVSK